MTRPELANVAHQWLTLWCAPIDWTLFERLHADDFEDCASAGRPPTKSGFASGLAEWAQAFPDIRARVEQLVVDEAAGTVAIRWSASGTNRAAYLGVGPTNRVTYIAGIEVIEVRGGRLVRRWGEWDISDHAPVG
jgi:steroid delta-isomerase-like uncharacterized protein